VITESPIIPMPLFLAPENLIIRPTLDGVCTVGGSGFVIGVGVGV